MAEIKKGDTVRLKSGGPTMTVYEMDANNAYCLWFDGSTPKRDSFDLAVLEIYPPKK